MDMGRKLTVLWNERELSNSVMLFTCFCCRAVLPNVPYRLNAQFGHLVIRNSQSYHISNKLSDMLTNANIEKCHQEAPNSPKVKMMFSRTKLIESSHKLFDMLTNANIEKCHQETPNSPKVKMMFSRTKLIESSLTVF